MRDYTILRLAAIAMVALCALRSGGQPAPQPGTPDQPRFFVWGPDGVPCGIEPKPNDFQAAIVKLQVRAEDTGTTAADRAFDYVLQHSEERAYWDTLNFGAAPTCHPQISNHVYTPDLVPSSICISIQGFGQDTSDIGGYAGSQLPFFREDDRMIDYINGTPLGDDMGFGFPFSAIGRRYRHPFLRNAGFREMELGAPPLEVWMREFVAHYLTRANGRMHLIPTRVYFDTEAPIMDAGSVQELFGNDLKDSSNSVRMLEQIWRSREQQPGGLTNYWTGVTVPGTVDLQHPNGQTLRDLYMEAAPLFGLPLDQNEPDLDLLNAGTSASPISAAAPVNRKIMKWWEEVCQRAQQQVMKNCVHEAVQGAWQNVFVGDYNVARHTGQARQYAAIVQQSTCGNDDPCWEDDYDYRNRSGIGQTREPNPETTSPVASMPSCEQGRNIDSAGFYYINPGPNGSERRWGGLVQFAFGNVDSPLLYPFENTQWISVLQRNAYARKDGTPPKNLMEVEHEATLRLHRHALEATEGGYFENTSQPVVPWIYSANRVRYSTSFGPVLFTEAELALDIALLRSKRVSEAILFHSYDFQTPAGREWARQTWLINERVIKDVCSPQMYKVRITDLTRNNQEYTDEPTLYALNNTLVDANQQRRAVQLVSTWDGVFHRAKLVASFNDRFSTLPRLSRLVNGPNEPPRDFLVNLEARARAPGGNSARLDVSFSVICRRENGSTFTLATFDGENSASSGRNDFGEVRCYYHVPNSVQDPLVGKVDPSTIEILATSRNLQQFHVEVDLVQVIPYTYSQARITGSNTTPALNMTVHTNPGSPLIVDPNVFATPGQAGGFQVVWDAALNPDPRRDHQVLRIYRQTGDPDHPFADITCATKQNFYPNDQTVQIKYYSERPTGPVLAPLPPGTYQIATFDRGDAATKTTCPKSVYSRLRTRHTGPIERMTPVAPEYFFIRVPGALMVSGCKHCNDGEDPPPPNCIADYDDGSSTGTLDGGVTIDDLLFYLFLFEEGHVCADVDDGNFTNTCDGGVTIDDLLYYLFRFEAGC